MRRMFEDYDAAYYAFNNNRVFTCLVRAPKDRAPGCKLPSGHEGPHMSNTFDRVFAWTNGSKLETYQR